MTLVLRMRPLLKPSGWRPTRHEAAPGAVKRVAYVHATRQAAYHANRAAVAMQLDNASGAVEDAEEAVKLNPQHVAAHLRAAKGYMALRQPEVRSTCTCTGHSA